MTPSLSPGPGWIPSFWLRCLNTSTCSFLRKVNFPLTLMITSSPLRLTFSPFLCLPPNLHVRATTRYVHLLAHQPKRPQDPSGCPGSVPDDESECSGSGSQEALPVFHEEDLFSHSCPSMETLFPNNPSFAKTIRDGYKYLTGVGRAFRPSPLR